MKVCMATRQGQFAPDAVMQQFEEIAFITACAGFAVY
jgi:hypothetical protein